MDGRARYMYIQKPTPKKSEYVIIKNQDSDVLSTVFSWVLKLQFLGTPGRTGRSGRKC